MNGIKREIKRKIRRKSLAKFRGNHVLYYRTRRREREKEGRNVDDDKGGRKKEEAGREWEWGERREDKRGGAEEREREKSTPRRAHCIPRIVRRCNPLWLADRARGSNSNSLSIPRYFAGPTMPALTGSRRFASATGPRRGRGDRLQLHLPV